MIFLKENIKNNNKKQLFKISKSKVKNNNIILFIFRYLLHNIMLFYNNLNKINKIYLLKYIQVNGIKVSVYTLIFCSFFSLIFLMHFLIPS